MRMFAVKANSSVCSVHSQAADQLRCNVRVYISHYSTECSRGNEVRPTKTVALFLMFFWHLILTAAAWASDTDLARSTAPLYSPSCRFYAAAAQ